MVLTWVTGLALDVICEIYANRRGRKGARWFILSLFISPVIAWLILEFSENKSEDQDKSSNKDLLAATSISIILPVIFIVTGTMKYNPHATAAPFGTAVPAVQTNGANVPPSPASFAVSRESKQVSIPQPSPLLPLVSAQFTALMGIPSIGRNIPEDAKLLASA